MSQRCLHLADDEVGVAYTAPCGVECELCAACVAEFERRFGEEDRTLRPLAAYARIEYECVACGERFMGNRSHRCQEPVGHVEGHSSDREYRKVLPAIARDG